MKIGLLMPHLYAQLNPTVRPYPHFQPAEDGDNLRAAMKGFGTDEQAIIDILTARSNSQRQEIAKYFSESLERDLIKDLKSELGGKFEDVIVGLMLPPDQYLCKQLNKAMAGMGTDDSALVEILCTKNNEEIKKLVAVYEDSKLDCFANEIDSNIIKLLVYDRPLAEHLCSETSGHFRRLLTLIITGVRDETGLIDPEKVNEHAQALYAAGEAKLGTDEKVFNRIMAHSSFAHLKLVFEEYKKVSGQTIEQAVKHEMGGELKDALMTLGLKLISISVVSKNLKKK